MYFLILSNPLQKLCVHAPTNKVSSPLFDFSSSFPDRLFVISRAGIRLLAEDAPTKR